MNGPPPEPPGDLDERRGRVADRLADGEAGAGDLDPAEAAQLARAAAALEEAVALGPAEIAALLTESGAVSAPVPPPDLPGDYEVLDEVGRGGMGIVYRARQRSLDRVVAVKVLRPGELLFGQALQRFQQEARVLARLRHPHIVSVHEVGEHNGRVFFTMDLIEGRPLSALLREGPLTPARAVRLLKQVAAAVAYVHAHGLVHRDLKPANILVDDQDHVTVTDFGLAFEVGAEDGLTLTGQVVGTPGYMSPEQARGDLAAVGEATDVHALGVLLYEMLTGRRPFQDLSLAEQVYAVIHHEPERPRRVNPSVPEALERVALQAMRKRPAERYASARAFLEDLERYEEGLTVRAKVRGRAYRFGRFVSTRRRGLAWAGVAVAVLVGVFASLGGFRLRSPRATLESAGDALAAYKDPLGASVLYQRALAESPGKRQPALENKFAKARVAWVMRLWEQDRIDEAAGVIQDTVERSARGYTNDRMREPYGGPLRWTLAVTRGLQGRWEEAERAFNEATHRRGWDGRDEPPDTPPGVVWDHTVGPSPWVLEHVAPALRDPTHPGRRVALVHLWPYVAYPHAFVSPGILAVDPPEGVTRGAIVVAMLEAILAGPDRIDRHWEFRGVLDQHLGPDLEAALLDATRDERRPLPFRRLTAYLLADLLDVPDLPGRFWGEMDPTEALDLHARLQAMSPSERRQHLLEEAVRRREELETAPAGESAVAAGRRRQDADELTAWIRTRAGAWYPKTWSELRAWWDQEQARDPVERLAKRLAIATRLTPDDVPMLLSRLVSASDADRPYLLTLLPLLADRGAPLYFGSRVREVPSQVMLAVQRRLMRLDKPRRLRIARILVEPTGFRVDPSFDRSVPFSGERPLELRHEVPVHAPDNVARFGIYFPPGSGTAQPPTSTLDLKLAVQPSPGGPVLSLWGSTWSSGHASWSLHGSGDKVHVDFVMAPNVDPRSWSDDQAGRNEIQLIVLERPDSPFTPWDVDQWRQRIVADVQRHADGAEAFERSVRRPGPGELSDSLINRYLYDHQQMTMRLAMLAAHFPLPDAVPALRRVFDAHRRGAPMGGQERVLVYAMLFAGDDTLLDDPALGPFLRGSGRFPQPKDAWDALYDDGMAWRGERSQNAIGAGGVFWVRALLHSPSQRVREFALERLAAIPLGAPAADDLLAAHKTGVVTLPPALLAKAEANASEAGFFWKQVRSSPVQSVAVLLLYLGLFWTGFRFALARATWKRLQPAGWLVLLGGAMACGTAVLAGHDLLPDDVGLGLMALGTGLLARRTRVRSRWIAPGLFAIGAAVSLAERWMPLSQMLLGVRTHGAAIGVALLPWLGTALAGRGAAPNSESTSMPWRFFGWLVLAIAVAMTVLAFGSYSAPLGADLWKVVVFIGATTGVISLGALVCCVIALAIGRLDVRRVLGWPLTFLVLYVLPTAVSAVVWLAWVSGAPPWPPWQFTLSGNVWIVLLLAFGLCVLWALLHPLTGARVRAAYLRLAASKSGEA